MQGVSSIALLLRKWVVILWLTMLMLLHFSDQLQSSETQTLLRIQKLLEYPRALENLTNTEDICKMPRTSFFEVGCENNTLTELHIVGDKPSPASQTFEFSETLSETFSADSLFTTLSRLYSLRALTLVSLGLWGPLSSKLDRLCFLETLNISKNFIHGSIPFQLSRLRRLQSFVMEENVLQGSVPEWFTAMPNLQKLSLKSNRLTGLLPSTFSSVQALRILLLSNNQLSGNLPDLSNMKNLQLLDIQHNRFGPEFPILGKWVIAVSLANNKFKVEIPKYLQKLEKLQYLDMSNNGFRGSVPSFLFSKPSIRYLNLAGNSLTGSLLDNLSCGPHLEFVDISDNYLAGHVPSCLMTSKTNKRVVKFAWNCLIMPRQRHSSHCQVVYASKTHKRRRNKRVLIGLAGGFVGGLTLLVVLLGFLLVSRSRRKKAVIRNQRRSLLREGHSTGIPPKLLINARYISKAIKLGTQGLPQYRSYALEEVEAATNNFHESALIGEGFYGKLYMGKMEDGTLVAVRRLSLKQFPAVQNLKLHFELFAKLRHLNLVTLLGHCIETEPSGSTIRNIFLIYEYVSNGTLQSHLSGSELRESLNWLERLKVASGLAKAVNFLHTGIVPGIYNNNLKITNVLLDEGYIAKLSDYGLPGLTIDMNEAFAENTAFAQKELSEMTRKRTVHGNDIYNFGLILLEILVGKPPVPQTGDVHSLVNLMMDSKTRSAVVDRVIVRTSVEESLVIVIELTAKCLSQDPDLSPSLEDILWNLQYATQLQDTCPDEEFV